MNNHQGPRQESEVRDSIIWSHGAVRWVTENTWRIEMKQKWIGLALVAFFSLVSLHRPAQAQNAAVNASWFAVTTDTSGAALPTGALQGYNLYYSLNQSDLSSTAQPPVVGTGATKVVVSPSNTSTSVNVPAGRTYYFGVTAFDSSGESGFSNIASTSPAIVVAPPPPPSSGTVSFVQNNASLTTNGASVSSSFLSNTTAGNLLIVAVDYTADSASLLSLTDTQGNTFTQIGTDAVVPGSIRSKLFYAKNIKGGADTVSATISTSSLYLELYIHEYSGADKNLPLDVTAQATGNGTVVNSGNAATTGSNELIFGYCIGGTVTAGNGFTARSNFDGNIMEDMQQATAGSVAATATNSGGVWTMIMAAFRPASGSTAFNYDVNRDGLINIADVQATVNQIIGLAPCTTGDVNRDGVCTVADAQLVVNKILGLIQ